MDSYGPAMRAVMYEEMRGVGSKPHVAVLLSSWLMGSGVGEFEMTFHASGAVTVNWNVAFRSGCSKTANTRRESGTSNWEYRYTSPSTGSTKRCSPSPVFVYSQSASTTRTFSSCRCVRAMRESA